MQQGKTERLAEHLHIFISQNHRFGTDAFLLSDFATPRRRDICCDLGCGCGIVGLLWFRRLADAPKKLFSVDIQPEAIAQLTKTVEQANLTGQVSPVLADLRTLQLEGMGQFDLVCCNPPYKIEGTGIMSESESDQLARHETNCTISEVAATAARLLRTGGRFCICQRPERLLDVLQAMRQNGIEPKRVRFVQQRADTAPWLFLAEGKRGAGKFMAVEPPLIIEGEGGFSKEMLRIYQKEKNI